MSDPYLSDDDVLSIIGDADVPNLSGCSRWPDRTVLELAKEVRERRAALSTRAGERERVIEECAAIADDAYRAATAMLPALDAYGDDYFRTRGAESASRIIRDQIKALASPTTVGGGEGAGPLHGSSNAEGSQK